MDASILGGSKGVVIPIILSQARAQSKEAQRTGSSIPGKGCTATLTLGDPNSVKQQVTRTSLASSPPFPPCSGPNSQPPPKIGSTRHPPDPRLQTPDLPFLGRLHGRSQLPSQKLRWKLSPCSASPPLEGSPQRQTAGCQGLASGLRAAARLAMTRRPAPAPSLAALPGRASLPRRGLGQSATTSETPARAPGKGTPLTPRNAGRHGAFSPPGNRHGS